MKNINEELIQIGVLDQHCISMVLLVYICELCVLCMRES